jgi:hypothetical protein
VDSASLGRGEEALAHASLENEGNLCRDASGVPRDRSPLGLETELRGAEVE